MFVQDGRRRIRHLPGGDLGILCQPTGSAADDFNHHRIRDLFLGPGRHEDSLHRLRQLRGLVQTNQQRRSLECLHGIENAFCLLHAR